MLDALILSDIHLGSWTTRYAELSEFLDHLPLTKLLILNGDTWDGQYITMSERDMDILCRLERLRLDGLTIIVNRGNHDPFPEAWGHLLGAMVQTKADVKSGDKTFCVIHGHAWDMDVTTRWIANPTIWLSRQLGHIWPTGARALAMWEKDRREISKLVDNGARTFRQFAGYSGIVCGHTHVYVDEAQEYGNTGCWKDNSAPGYAEIAEGALTMRLFV